MRTPSRRDFGFAIAAALLWLAKIASAEDNVKDDNVKGMEVHIDNFTFEPAKLTVKAGTTVTWINRDDIPHLVVLPGKFRSEALDTNDKFSFTFTTAGDYKYFCSLHPHMTGMIKVE